MNVSLTSIPEFAADQALVKTTAFIICGTTLMPAKLAAITNGDWAAFPFPCALNKSSEFDGTSNVTTKTEST